MSDTALTPAEQALVPFHDNEISSARLPDGAIIASLPSLCNILKIAVNGQARRIRRDQALSKYLLRVLMETPGGPQITDALVAWAIPLWLMGLQPNMIAPEKRSIATALKEEAVDVLYRYFAALDAEEVVQEAPTPAQKAPRSALEMHIEAWQAALEMQTEAWQETEREWDARETRYEGRIAALEQQQAQMQARLAALEQHDGGARGEEPPPQAGRILSQAHIGQVYALAQHHRRQTGEPISDMLRDLAETFGVPDMSDIPDEGWDYVLRWFWSRAQR